MQSSITLDQEISAPFLLLFSFQGKNLCWTQRIQLAQLVGVSAFDHIPLPPIFLFLRRQERRTPAQLSQKEAILAACVAQIRLSSVLSSKRKYFLHMMTIKLLAA